MLRMTKRSVAKMPDIRKNHRHVSLINGGDYFFIAHRTTGLNCTAGTSIGGGEKSIGKWEKGIARERAAFE